MMKEKSNYNIIKISAQHLLKNNWLFSFYFDSYALILNCNLNLET